ncbi:hypothetical protein [Enterobacter asburiae]|uniref:hypothetical protein n=1 Tax=Enterobacter asburiae TaxID=61645 RepID=UPI001CD1C569|nr:hypothetical protein [Enterobacter asburiae]
MKTYYIHPMAFGSTQDPGHGHVHVVKVDEAEKRIAELQAREVKLPERYEVEMCPTPSPNGEVRILYAALNSTPTIATPPVLKLAFSAGGVEQRY